jgi:Kef-type K+ transport system membrane component KefB
MSQITEQKAVLEAKSSAYQQEIVEEIADIKQVAKERGGQILIAGGVLAGAYLLYSLFSDSSKKSDKNESSFIGNALTSYAVGIALSLVKDQLLDYLKKLESESTK